MNPKITGVGLNTFYNVTPVTLTGTTTATLLQKILIPGGTYAAGDLLIINALFGKTGTANVFTWTLYSSPNDPSVSGISGATQLAVRGVGSTRLFIDMGGRHLYIKNASGGGSGIELGTELAATTTSIFNEMRSTGASNVAINWQNNMYIFMYGQLSSSADSVTQEYLKIWEY